RGRPVAARDRRPRHPVHSRPERRGPLRACRESQPSEPAAQPRSPARVGMKRPPELVYGLEEAPPPVVTMLLGVQHVGLIAINLVYPLLVFRVAGTPPHAVVDLIGAGMLVLAAATVLQARRGGPLGSRFMSPAVFTATYLGPSLTAAKVGGLPLVFGMTIFAGFLEAALAPLLNRLRPIFPPEISGLVIFMIGVSAAVAGLRLMLGG